MLSAEMPRYVCHKVVHALQIQAVIGSNLVFEDSDFDDRDMGHEWVSKHQPVAGGWLVVYKDGYESFSPAEAFEDGYTRIK